MILLVLILSMNQLVLSLILHFRAYIAALHHFKTDSLISIADKLLAIILVASGWLFFAETDSYNKIIAFSVSQTIALTLTAITAFIVLQKHVFLKAEKWNNRPSKQSFRLFSTKHT